MRHKQPPPPPPPQIDPSQLKDITCDACGNYTFDQVALLKLLPALASPNSKDTVVPIGVFQCVACGHINDALIPPIYKQAKTDEEKKVEGPDARPHFDAQGNVVRDEVVATPEPEVKSSIIQIVK